MGIDETSLRTRCALVCMIFMGLFAGRCAADAPASVPDSQAVAAAPEFAKTLWTVDAFGSFADRFAGTPFDMPMGAVGFDTYIYDNIGVGAELGEMYAPQPNPAWGTSLSFNIRGHFLTGDGWTIYGETDLGLSLFDAASPPGGSRGNFLVGAGGGFTLRLTERIDLMAGARFFHLSNAGLIGQHHNPSFNAAQGYAGLMFKL